MTDDFNYTGFLRLWALQAGGGKPVQRTQVTTIQLYTAKPSGRTLSSSPRNTEDQGHSSSSTGITPNMGAEINHDEGPRWHPTQYPTTYARKNHRARKGVSGSL